MSVVPSLMKEIEHSDENQERIQKKVYKIAVEKTFLQETRNRFQQKGFKYFSLLERRCFYNAYVPWF